MTSIERDIDGAGTMGHTAELDIVGGFVADLSCSSVTAPARRGIYSFCIAFFFARFSSAAALAE